MRVAPASPRRSGPPGLNSGRGLPDRTRFYLPRLHAAVLGPTRALKAPKGESLREMALEAHVAASPATKASDTRTVLQHGSPRW